MLRFGRAGARIGILVIAVVGLAFGAEAGRGEIVVLGGDLSVR